MGSTLFQELALHSGSITSDLKQATIAGIENAAVSLLIGGTAYYGPSVMKEVHNLLNPNVEQTFDFVGVATRTDSIHPQYASDEAIREGVSKWNKDVKKYNRNYAKFQRSWFRPPKQNMEDKYYVDHQAARMEMLHGESMGAKEDTDWGNLSRSRLYHIWRNMEAMQESAEHLEERDVRAHFDTVDRNDFFMRLKSWAAKAPNSPAGQILESEMYSE